MVYRILPTCHYRNKGFFSGQYEKLLGDLFIAWAENLRPYHFLSPHSAAQLGTIVSTIIVLSLIKIF